MIILREVLLELSFPTSVTCFFLFNQLYRVHVTKAFPQTPTLLGSPLLSLLEEAHKKRLQSWYECFPASSLPAFLCG